MKITREVYLKLKKDSKTTSISDMKAKTELSSSTIRRIKKSKSFADYKNILALDNPNKKHFMRLEVEPGEVKTSWFKRIFG